MSRACVIFAAAASFLTLCAGTLLIVGYPTVQRLPAWFWPFQDKQMLDIGVIVVFAFALPLAVRFVATGAEDGYWRFSAGLAALILLGFVLQQGLAFAEKRGFDGMRDQIRTSGHAEFARTAGLDLGAWNVLLQYEELMEAPGQDFARSKPPGQLLFYMGLAHVAERVLPDDTQETISMAERIGRRHKRLVHFAAIVLPLLSYMALIPLTLLGRLLLPPGRALWPALLYILVPPTALVTLHLDQAVYPTFAAGVLALAAYAGRAATRPWLPACAAGAVAWLGLFVTFSLLPILPLAAAFAWATIDATEWRTKMRRWLGVLAAFGGAFVLLTILALTISGYDAIHRFQAAMVNHRLSMAAFHSDWEGWPDQSGLVLQAGFLNLVEFSYWLGMPVLGLFLWSVVAALGSLARRRSEPADLIAGGTAIVLAATALLGGSIGEVARIWIFMVPAVVLVAADRLSKLASERPVLVWHIVAACQFAWMFLLKAKQDF